MAGGAIRPGIVAAMSGIDGDPQLFDVQYSRLPPYLYHQFAARTVISQVETPVLLMLKLYIHPQYIVLHLLIPGIPDLFCIAELRDPVGIAGDAKYIHDDPGGIDH